MEPHEILGISKDASEHQIRLAYKALAMKWHPDRHPLDKAEATAKFVEINTAHRAMLRNLRRARRKTKANESTTMFDESLSSSPESTSSSLPESSTPSTRSSTPCSSSPPQNPESSRSPSVSSFTSAEASPTRSSSSEDKCKTRGRSGSRSTDFPNPLQPSSADNLSSHLYTDSCSSSSQPDGKKLRKRARSKNSKVDPDAGEGTPKHFPCEGVPHIVSDPEHVVETLRPSRAVLRGAGADAPKKWVHSLTMTLEEIVQGKSFHFRVIRYARSGKKQVLPLEVYVPSGSRGGTEIILQGVGNERKDGTWQDISFTIRELKHDRFTRIHDDLFMDVRLPWVDNLNDREGKVYLQGVDPSEYLFTVAYYSTRLLSGTAVIPGAGIPYIDGTGRGRIIVRWEISSPLSSWDAIKNVLRFRN